MKHAPLIRRAAKEEGEGGSGGDGCAGQGVWRTQETHCRLDGAQRFGPKRHIMERVPQEYVVNKAKRTVSTELQFPAYWIGC